MILVIRYFQKYLFYTIKNKQASKCARARTHTHTHPFLFFLKWSHEWACCEQKDINVLGVNNLESIQWHQWPAPGTSFTLVYPLAWTALLRHGHSEIYLIFRDLSNEPSVRSENHKVGKNLSSFPFASQLVVSVIQDRWTIILFYTDVCLMPNSSPLHTSLFLLLYKRNCNLWLTWSLYKST